MGGRKISWNKPRSCKVISKVRTDSDGYSGNRYSGNDGYSGLNPPDDAILFTVSGITAIADKKLEILILKNEILMRFFIMAMWS